ncbi:hypothetical protein SCACP_35530 [Sporomusa carbonis]|uniref:hypothetical protein n=1 Tax=Sporomusa carbonis TaxID=3076075 RepID=UPI003A6F148F
MNRPGEQNRSPLAGKRVSIRFCGGCNPRIDRGQIAGQIREFLTARGVDVVYNTDAADVIIYLSGCPADCAYRYSDGGSNIPSLIVRADTVDGITVGTGELAAYIAAKTISYIERPETSTK